MLRTSITVVEYICEASLNIDTDKGVMLTGKYKGWWTEETKLSSLLYLQVRPRAFQQFLQLISGFIPLIDNFSGY